MAFDAETSQANCFFFLFFFNSFHFQEVVEEGMWKIEFKKLEEERNKKKKRRKIRKGNKIERQK